MKKIILLAITILWTFLSSIGQINISHSVSPTDSRLFNLTFSQTQEVAGFRVSESPTFEYGDGEGIEISVQNIAPDNSWADVLIEYPDGQQGPVKSSYSIPDKNTEIKVLVALFGFAEEDGTPLTSGSDYMTPLYAQRKYFCDNNGVGVDAQSEGFCIADHIYQSTLGQISFTGEVLPDKLYLDARSFRNSILNSNSVYKIPERLRSALINQIESSKPGWIDAEDFDMIIFESDEFATFYWDFYSQGLGKSPDGKRLATAMYSGVVATDNRELFGFRDEEQLAHNKNTVFTNFNITNVRGVWLASDTDKTGINYFTGGEKVIFNKFTYIKLGTELPSENEAIIVEYNPQVFYTTSDPIEDGVEDSKLYPLVVHEIYHLFGLINKVITKVENSSFPDLYNGGDELTNYATMAKSNLSGYVPNSLIYYDEAPLLSGINKDIQGFAKAHTLTYNINPGLIRIHNPTFKNLDQVKNNVTLVKVPLNAEGDMGIAFSGDDRGIAFTDDKGLKVGEEYILLEWRGGTEFSDGYHNVDRHLPSKGLIMKRVVKLFPYNMYSLGWFTLLDATPNVSPVSGLTYPRNSTRGLEQGRIALGNQSSVMTYKVGSLFEEIDPGSSSINYKYLVSEGQGDKTLFFEFYDSEGRLLQSETLEVNNTEDNSAEDRKMTMSVTGAVEGQIFTNSFCILKVFLTGSNPITGISWLRENGRIIETDLTPGSSRSQYFGFSSQGTYEIGVRAVDASGTELEKVLTVCYLSCCDVDNDFDIDGVCTPNDCDDTNAAIGDIGSICDDNDPCTTGDAYDNNCLCTGIYKDSDNDGVCDAQDQCNNLNDSLINTSCNDEDSCTENDTYNNNCECLGTVQDSDGDSICDSQDQCSGMDDNLIGQLCDDDNPCTSGEIYDSNCSCSGGKIEDIYVETSNAVITNSKSVQEYIQSNGIIQSGNIEYTAGDYILLLNGFEVILDAEFEIRIEDCN